MACIHNVCQLPARGLSVQSPVLTGWLIRSHSSQTSVACASSSGRRSYSTSAPSEGRRSTGRGGRGRGPPTGGRGRGPARERPQRAQSPPQTTDENFADALSTLQAALDTQQVIRKESWERLFNLVRNEAHADAVFALLQADAGVRDALGWNWDAEGYGQTVPQLVQAAAGVGVPDMAERIISSADQLHLNVSSKDFLPSLIRRVAGGASGDKASQDALLRLYAMERTMHGRNSHMSAHELSRVYRRSEDVQGVQDILQQVAAGEADVKPDLVEVLNTWLAKRGVRT